MREGDNVGDALFSARRDAVHVPAKERAEGLLVRPRRTLRRHRLDLIDCEGELGVERLLAPERTVVVEDSDALGRLHEVTTVLVRHTPDKIDDRVLRGAVVPRWQRVALHLRSAVRRCDDRGETRRHQGPP